MLAQTQLTHFLFGYGQAMNAGASGLTLPYTDAFTNAGAFATPWLNAAWSKTGGAGVAAVTLGAELDLGKLKAGEQAPLAYWVEDL